MNAGQILDGKYRLESLIGKGGMGAVYRATHLGTSRTVAVKVMAPELCGQSDFLARFQSEARAAGQMHHPNVVDLTDFGESQGGGERIGYLVMEFLAGESLASYLERQARPPLAEVVTILRQVASGLEAAHGMGIIHRDLKPDNIWLEPDPLGGFRAKILDFGLAKLFAPAPPVLDLTDDEDAPTVAVAKGRTTPMGSRTEVGTVMGTPAYMSPEQCSAFPVSPQTDLYSLGVILYQMLAGTPPFKGNTEELIRAHTQRNPPPLAAERPDLPPGLCALVMATLSKDPEARPRSAEAFARAFQALASTGFNRFQKALSLFGEFTGPLLKSCARVAAPALVALLGLVLVAAWYADKHRSVLGIMTFHAAMGLALGACYLAYFRILALVAPLALLRELLPQEPIPATELLDSVRRSGAGRALGLTWAAWWLLDLLLVGGQVALYDAVPASPGVWWSIHFHALSLLLSALTLLNSAALLTLVGLTGGPRAMALLPPCQWMEGSSPRAARARIKHLQALNPERSHRGFLAEFWLGAILTVQLISSLQLIRVLLPPHATFSAQLTLLRPGLPGFFAWLTLGLLLTYGPLMLLDAVTSAQDYLRLRLASMEPLDADLTRLRQLLRTVKGKSSHLNRPPSRPHG